MQLESFAETRKVKSIGFVAWLILAPALYAQPAFPGKEWTKAPTPEAVGWSTAALSKAKAYAESIDSSAVMVVHGGQVVWEWGETSRPFECHSMRKSILSVLYGRHVAARTIELGWTLRRLGIDDRAESLSETEKEATVEMLLQARSGIYHPALYESPGMKARRPTRGSHAPGTFWYYNNWDFNALGTIFENLTGRGVFEEFEDRLARPLGMQDFRREAHTSYVTGSDSVHPAYPFRLSARDLARFGLLCARGGRWKDRQLVPVLWMLLSTHSYSDAGSSGGYGYMWWVTVSGVHFPGVTLPDGSYSARGYRGHYVVVVPSLDLVVVHRVDTFTETDRVTSAQFGELLYRILRAGPPGVRPTIARF